MALKARVEELGGAKPEIIGRSDRDEERIINFVKRTSERLEEEIAQLAAKLEQRPVSETTPLAPMDLAKFAALEREIQN